MSGTMQEIKKLIKGYKRFFHTYFTEGDKAYQKLAREGQNARVAMIACSDSRVDPSIITDSNLGELFVIRNVANLVPPYQPDDSSYHGTSAALEFAVGTLGVSHVVVLGHSKCAGIRSLVEEMPNTGGYSFIRSWMQIASGVRKQVMEHYPDSSIDEKAHLCERKAVEQSLQNLQTFPWIKSGVKAKTLHLHGWHFDLEAGSLHRFNPTNKKWVAFESASK